MKHLVTVMTIAVVALLTAQGCSRVIGEGYEAATGAKGIYAPITPLSEAADTYPLAGYTTFELQRFADDFGGNTPPELFTYMPNTFGLALTEKRIPNVPGGRTLIIRGKILHYEDKSRVGISAVLGPLEQVIARVEFVDKASGKVLGVANCVGRTTKSVGQGVDKKAQGLAKAIVSWIDKQYPPEEGRLPKE